jgi:hypothetical protein
MHVIPRFPETPQNYEHFLVLPGADSRPLPITLD